MINMFFTAETCLNLGMRGGHKIEDLPHEIKRRVVDNYNLPAHI